MTEPKVVVQDDEDLGNGQLEHSKSGSISL